MARVHAPLLSFSAGEVSRLALARVDVEKMRLAAETQVNWSPNVLGAMMLRPGTGYLFSTRSNAACNGIPFVFGFGDTALLEFTDSHLRVIVSDALVTRASVSTSVTNGDFASSVGWTLAAADGTADINSTVSGSLYLAAGATGALVSCLRDVTVAGGDQATAHAFRVTVTRGPVVFMIGTTSGGTELLAKTELATGTHSLVVTPGAGTIYLKFESARRHGVVVDSVTVESSGALDLPTPYVAADLSKLRYDQSGDVVFIACDGYQQRRIERRDNGSWSIVTYYADDGPFKALNTEKTRTILPSGENGSVGLIGAETDFSANDVGAIFRIDESDLSLTPEWKESETLSLTTTAGVVSGTKIGDMTNLANAFDGNPATAATKTSASGYIGTSLASAEGVFSATMTMSCPYAHHTTFNSGTFKLYGKTGSAPANGTDGTLIGTLTTSIATSSTSYVILSTDTTSTWDHIWVSYVLNTSGALSVWTQSRLKFDTGGAIVLRRYIGNVYQAIAGTTTGTVPPIHEEGDVLSEPGGTGVIWRYRHGPFGIVRITSVTNATAADADVLKPLPKSAVDSPTYHWARGAWNIADGFPTEVKFHEGRLWWFRGDQYWASVSDDYTSYDSETEGDSGTIDRTFGSGPIAKVNWALSLTRLAIGREMSIDAVRSSSQEEPITPTNNASKTCSTKGAAELPALKIGTRAVYVEKSGRRVYALTYSSEAGDYVTRDLTRLNLDIGIPGFVSLAVQEEPDTSLIFVRDDGEVAILLYEPGEDIACWWRIMTLGIVERVVTLPGALEDSVYFVVQRTINGSTVRYWEKMTLRSQCVGGSLSRNLDCHLAVSQASSTTISGLSHLEGELVYVWANGKDLGSYTVASAAITVSEAVTTAIVGLGGVSFSYDSSTAAASVTCATKYNGYPCEVFADGKYVGAITIASGIATLPKGRTAKKITAYLGFYAPFRSSKLAYGAQMGTALGQNKKIEKVGLIAFDTHYQGVQWGSSIDNLQPLPLSKGGQDIATDTVFEEHDEPMVGLSGSWNADSRLHLLAQAPKPATVSAVMVAVSTNEAR